MTTKTWNLTLTPVDGSVEHLDGLSQRETLDAIRELIGGFSAADVVAMHQQAAARAEQAPALALAA